MLVENAILSVDVVIELISSVAAVWLSLTVQTGAFWKGTAKVTVHAEILAPVPIVPAVSFPCIVAPVPQDDTVGIAEPPVKICPPIAKE